MLRRERTSCNATTYVVGIGNGGITAVNRLLERGVYGVSYIAMDTDEESLAQDRAGKRIQVDDPETAVTSLRAALDRPDIVFVVGGLGGQTGTQLAPAVAAAARKQGALVLAIVTLPFAFEGQHRSAKAHRGADRLKEEVHTLITIPNDRLLDLAGDELPFNQTYQLAEEVWYQSIQGIHRLVNVPGLVNVDFADVKTIMADGGPAVITRGRAQGPRRAHEAALQATRSDLLGITIDGARGILFNVTAGPDLTLEEVREAASVIGKRAHPDANIIFGTAMDFSLGDELEITVVATGCGMPVPQVAPAPRRPNKRTVYPQGIRLQVPAWQG
jgi:cell division protein FtsZ